jgi:DNA-binding FadR family transcriptional regulator
LRIFNVDGGPEHGQFHHKRILEAVERHDAQAARELMRAHLTQVDEDSRSAQSEDDAGRSRNTL